MLNISGIVGNSVSEAANARLLAWQDKVIAEVIARNPSRASEARFAGNVPIHMLPISRQIEHMRTWRNITGLDTVLNTFAFGAGKNTQIDSIFNNMNVLSPRDSESPFLRFPVSGKSFIDDYFRGINMNFSEKFRPVIAGLENPDAAVASSHFGPGIKSIPKLAANGSLPPRSLPPGARFTTFDIETASLMHNQIREISYKSGVVDSVGGINVNNTTNGQILFRPRGFARGSMGMADYTGQVRPYALESFMESRYGLGLSKLPTSNLGEDYAKRMVPFLENLRDSDYVIGHNIARFDIPQVFTALSGTEAYKSVDQSVIPGFRDLVDETHRSIQDKIVDTLELARRAPNLGNLGVATELADMKNLSTYSIENLLLETDLADMIGVDELEKVMGGKGLHFGAVDDLVTLNIYKFLPDLQPKRLGGTVKKNALRRQILDSAAITPFTDIRSQTAIADPVLRHVIGVDGGIKTKSQQLRDLLTAAQSGDKQAAEEAFNLIRSGQVDELDFKLNPIEHQVISTRNLGLGLPTDVSRSVDPDSLIFNSNIFDREVYGKYDPRRNFARGILDQKRISDEEMGVIQGKLAKAGMPWAGLSFEERSLGTVLSHLTSQLSPSPMARDIGKLTSDTLISRFEQFDPSDVAYRTRSGRSSLPINLLQEAGLLGGDETKLLTLSSVNPTVDSPVSRMNLVYNFQKGEAERLANYMTELAANPDDVAVARALGIDTDLYPSHADEILNPVGRFREAVNERGLVENILEGTRGVAVGQLQPKEAESVIQAVANFTGLDELTDKSMLKFGLPFARTRNGLVETSGVVMTRHLDSAGLADVGRQVAHSTKVLDAFEQLGDTGNTFKLKAAQAYSSVGGDKATDAIKRGYEAYQSFRPHIPKALGIGLLAGAGMLLLNRREEVQQYAPTMAEMPYESGQSRYRSADMLQMSIDSGVNKGRQRYDPLATAFVTSNLSDSAIGHTAMNWDKNNSLYGGVL